MTYLLSVRDVFVSLPICSGKSLCYCPLLKPSTYFVVRVAGLKRQSIEIVVSPLVIDQVR